MSWRNSLVLAGAMLVSIASVRCTSKLCTAMGCESGAGFQTSFSTNAAAETLVITVCRNSACSSAAMSDPCLPIGCTRSLNLVGPVGGNAVLEYDPVTHVHSVTMWASATGAGEREALRDGDTYTFTVATRDGKETPFSATRVATYSQYYANGESCDGPNGYCRNANLAEVAYLGGADAGR
jgi:hypothetical protein